MDYPQDTVVYVVLYKIDITHFFIHSISMKIEHFRKRHMIGMTYDYTVILYQNVEKTRPYKFIYLTSDVDVDLYDITPNELLDLMGIGLPDDILDQMSVSTFHRGILQ